MNSGKNRVEVIFKFLSMFLNYGALNSTRTLFSFILLMQLICDLCLLFFLNLLYYYLLDTSYVIYVCIMFFNSH